MTRKYQIAYKIRTETFSKRIMGTVVNSRFEEVISTNIQIIHDELLMKAENRRLLLSGVDGNYPVIIVDEEFLNLKPQVAAFGIWHEIGHIDKNHFIKYKSQEEIRKKRIKAINNGEIMLEEKEADLFAVERVGKIAAVKFLEQSLISRPKGHIGSQNDLGLIELQLRIDFIKSLKK
ncbi:hypothetical protein [Syntrophomonas wolfei]|jgi:hypothetical protein|uniref:hypothetical protein n=1 Tax=Syntrophomonas wolfei TaxID=863 RepID=UPI0023F05522|nr:hypothetical protein [Syntrophomonas wolfei]